MKKISSIILTAIFSLSIFTAFSLNGFIYVNSIKYIRNETEQKLVLLSGLYTENTDKTFHEVENTIENINRFIRSSFNIQNLTDYLNIMDNLLKETALENNFESIYITFNPELTNEFNEVWYLKLDEKHPHQRVDNTLYKTFNNLSEDDFVYPDLNQFNTDNPAMDYYYTAAERKSGQWYEPVKEAGLPMTAVSYTCPIYKDGILLGVTGIDINIETIKQSILTSAQKDNASSFLLNSQFETIAHPDHPELTKLEITNPEISEQLKQNISESGIRGSPVILTDNKMIYSVNRLANDWLLLMAFEKSRIIKPLNDLIFIFIIMTVLVSVFSFLAARAVSYRISIPFELAVVQLKNIVEGEYDNKPPPYFSAGNNESSQMLKSVEAVSKLIKEEVEKNRHKDAVLAYQSRLAKAGEIISHIAHQWRQPINNLNLIFTNIKESCTEDWWTNVNLEKYLAKCMGLTASMSETIEDFLYYLKPRQVNCLFSINGCISFVTEMLEFSLKSENITIETDLGEIPYISGSAGNFTQVISNILSNAVEALSNSNKKERRIFINSSFIDHMILINILNNGPSIPDEILKNLFVPYFTTKHDIKGTGIGLYISRQIIEDQFSGTISIENTEKGVLYHINIPF